MISHWQQHKVRFYFKLLFNIIFWGIWIGLPMLSPVHHPHELGDHPHPHSNNEFTEHLLTELLTVVPLFYFVTMGLFPWVFKRKGTLALLLSLLPTMLIAYVFQNVWESYLLPFEDPRASLLDFRGFYPIFTITAIATVYGLLLEFLDLESSQQELQRERMESELAFLRNQISPHFIFNVLNSIVYLIRTKADTEAEHVTLKLSSLLRYMLYDSDQAMIPLDKEFDYLQSYIELQKIRFGEDVEIDFSMKGKIRYCMIEPMLLIPFVENAFKHGVAQVRAPKIQLEFDIDHGNFHFKVINRMDTRLSEDGAHGSGIGLRNVKRRLELLYPSKHRLDIQADGENYSVQLHMTLDKKNTYGKDELPGR